MVNKTQNKMKTSVKLNNGTILEVGKNYTLPTWNSYVECIMIRGEQCVMMELDELDEMEVNAYDIRKNWLPYTAPKEEVKWKTFLIEVEWSGYTTRELLQFKSLEIAKKHEPNAISITEVEIEIKEVK